MSDKIKCWQCGSEYDEDECFCPECDADIEPDEPTDSALAANKIAQKPYLAVICSQCGGGIMLGSNGMTGTCRHCGTAFVANPSVVKPSANQDSKITASSVYKPPKTSQKKSAKIWAKLFAEHTPNCQFCGEPQDLTIGYLFHEMKYLLRCKHCQAEFKCDFTFGGKMKEWTAEIVHCGNLRTVIWRAWDVAMKL